MQETNSSILGMYFIVFQTQFNGFVKVYVDGDDNCDFYFKDDFLNLALKINNPKLYNELSEALTESSFYLWDIDNNTVKRLRATPSILDSAATLLTQKVNELRRPNVFSKSNPVGFDGNTIFQMK